MGYASDLQEAFNARRALLEAASESLERRLKETLVQVSHIDRIVFRVKGTSSFVRKCTDDEGQPALVDGTARYSEPLAEVEDQIAGRVLVFFRDDLPKVEGLIRDEFRAAVEFRKREPESSASFGYESDHFVFVIDEHMKPEGWAEMEPMPATFELQVRTLFMHAYAEPQHDIGYKGDEPLDSDIERQFAWIAASAWGADMTLNGLYLKLSEADRASAGG